jgi:hypothetical protein
MADKLFGIGAHQVPKNSDLGSAAYKDESHFISSDLTSKYPGFNQRMLGDDAPVGRAYIYDTKLDSDGGAWRHRCQHTSWYNEELNTAYRGSRREFPEVVIITEENGSTGRVVIYDADDPSCPMWMVFAGTGSWNTSALGGPRQVTTICALNGLLAVGRNPYGYHSVNFINENIQFREAGYFRYLYGGIAKRNYQLVVSEEMGGQGDLQADLVNWIDMTVIKDTPVNPETGIQNPTVAIAQYNGGITIFWHDNRRIEVNAAAGATYQNVDRCFIDTNGDLYFGQDGASGSRPQFRMNVYPSVNTNTSYTSTTNDGDPTDKDASTNHTAGLVVPYVGDDANNKAYRQRHILWADSSVGYGFNIIDKQPHADQRNGMIASIGASWNTGWKPSNCFLATLNETIHTPDRISNGIPQSGEKLDQNKSNWSTVGGAGTTTNTSYRRTGSGESSAFTLVGEAGGHYAESPTFSVKKGEKYILSFQALVQQASSGDYHLQNVVYDGNGTTISGFAPTWMKMYQLNKWTHVSRIVQFGTTGSSAKVRIGVDDNETIFVDQVSLIPYVENRQTAYEGQYGNHIRQVGVVQKQPVAPNAELLCYSGFGSSTYFKVPFTHLYANDSFSVMCWYRGNNGHLAGSYGDGEGTMWRLEFSSNKIRWMISDGSTQVEIVDPDVSSPDRWHCLVVQKDRNYIKMFKDGNLVSTNYTSNLNVTDNKHGMTIGVRPDNYGEAFNGQISLFRYASSANLTADQIGKAYEDELKLFQANSKCTMHGLGSSSADNRVYDADYDEQTELVHVVAGKNRSSFRGLSLVDHVTRDDAIYRVRASNGLVLEI